MKIKLLLLVIGVYLFLAGRVIAQGIQVSYPIWELGGCRDEKECYFYCEVPQNKAACWSYGKYVMGEDVLGETTMTFPIAELGNCQNKEGCYRFCQNPANKQPCIDYSIRMGDKTNNQKQKSYYDAQTKQKMLEAARRELNCDSPQSCGKRCEKDPEGCKEFMLRNKFELIQEKRTNQDKSPRKNVNCNSEESCRKYCSEHPNECPRYDNKESTQKKMEMMQKMRESREKYEESSDDRTPVGGYMGPSGCRTEGECRFYCESNPEKCPGFQRPRPTIFQQQHVPYISPEVNSGNYPPREKTDYSRPSEEFSPPENFTPPQNYQPQENYGNPPPPQ